MYIDIVREVVESSVSKKAVEGNRSREEVLSQIRRHIDDTSRQWRQPTTNINYYVSDCRIGYLYRQGPAQAAVFERALSECEHLRAILKNKRELRVVAIGGGPGTELLGLIKLLGKVPNDLTNITFDVLDLVPQWRDTWDQFRRKVKALTSLVIEANFSPLDVFKKESYAHYDTLFSDADMVVFNYIFSENQIVLDQAKHAVRHIWNRVPPGCAFVVIDRNQAALRVSLSNMLRSIIGEEPAINEMKGYLDGDERKKAFGDLTVILGDPRMSYKAFSCVHIKGITTAQTQHIHQPATASAAQGEGPYL